MRTFSLLLIAIGAILTFAVNFFVEGVDLVAVGVILMIVGAIGLAVGFARGSLSTRVERQVSDDGRSVVENRRTSSV